MVRWLDTDGDGVCDQEEIIGCQDASDVIMTKLPQNLVTVHMPFYIMIVIAILNDTDEDGVCDELEIIGQDASACNYDETATDSGDCTYAILYYDCDNNCLKIQMKMVFVMN